jgi:hypothetical protein
MRNRRSNFPVLASQFVFMFDSAGDFSGFAQTAC